MFESDSEEEECENNTATVATVTITGGPSVPGLGLSDNVKKSIFASEEEEDGPPAVAEERPISELAREPLHHNTLQAAGPVIPGPAGKASNAGCDRLFPWSRPKQARLQVQRHEPPNAPGASAASAAIFASEQWRQMLHDHGQNEDDPRAVINR